jgi:hypothetical protein
MNACSATNAPAKNAITTEVSFRSDLV